MAPSGPQPGPNMAPICPQHALHGLTPISHELPILSIPKKAPPWAEASSSAASQHQVPVFHPPSVAPSSRAHGFCRKMGCSTKIMHEEVIRPLKK